MTIRLNVIYGSPLIAIDTIKAGDSAGIQSTMVAPQNLGIIVAEWRDSKLNILYENSINRPTFTQSIELIQSLLNTYGGIKKILIDGSQPGFIRELKERYNDSYKEYHLMKPEIQDRFVHSEIPLVVAINWQRHRKAMLEKAYTMLSKNMVHIDPKFSKLTTALRTATSTPADTDYDKTKTSWSDVLDAFLQLSLVLQNKG